jgi:hypothetical protein
MISSQLYSAGRSAAARVSNRPYGHEAAQVDIATNFPTRGRKQERLQLPKPHPKRKRLSIFVGASFQRYRLLCVVARQTMKLRRLEKVPRRAPRRSLAPRKCCVSAYV